MQQRLGAWTTSMVLAEQGSRTASRARPRSQLERCGTPHTSSQTNPSSIRSNPTPCRRRHSYRWSSDLPSWKWATSGAWEACGIPSSECQPSACTTRGRVAVASPCRLARDRAALWAVSMEAICACRATDGRDAPARSQSCVRCWSRPFDTDTPVSIAISARTLRAVMFSVEPTPDIAHARFPI